MTENIDGSEIIGTDLFKVRPNIDRFTLDRLAFESVMRLFNTLAPQLTDLTSPPSGDKWTGPIRTRKNFNALCDLPEDIDQLEFERRYKAVGEGPNNAVLYDRFSFPYSTNAPYPKVVAH